MNKIKMLSLLLFVLFLSVMSRGDVFAASGKCTVVKVDGVRMVIECNKETKGFAQGNPIKIKSDKKRDYQNN